MVQRYKIRTLSDTLNGHSEIGKWCRDADVSALEAENARLTAKCDLYDATRADLHKMCGREGEPTTHGLDYTTILGHMLTRLESENAKLREIVRPFGMAQVEHLHSYPDSELVRTSIGSFSLGDFRRAVKVQKGEA